MSRQDHNARLLETSFLYGANAAYIENLHARFEADPGSVDGEWQAFFGGLADERAAVEKRARGAAWKAPNWPILANGEMVAALDANWGATEKAVSDKIKIKAARSGNGISED